MASTNGTSKNVPITEEQIQSWAGETERGYAVDGLITKGRSRSASEGAPSHVVSMEFFDALETERPDQEYLIGLAEADSAFAADAETTIARFEAQA